MPLYTKAAEPVLAAPPKVFVCILNWNKRDDTLHCLEAVLEQDYPNLRVVVVDNGSTDCSVPALRGLGTRIDLVEHQENLGFTGGCNAGVRHALAHGGDYVWLLNNDSECEPDTLSRLVAYAEPHPDLGMVSPIITDRRSGTDNFAVGRLDLATGIAIETADAAEAEAIQERYPKQIMLKGTALLLKRSLIERAGLLDEQFFAYCEDNDYSVRCAAAGFRSACVTTTRVYHDEGLPGGGWRKPYAYYYAARNGILFWRKHATGLSAWKYARWHACTIFRVLARAGYGRAETEAFADGLWSGLRGGTGRWEPSCSLHRMPYFLRCIFVSRPALSLGLMEADPRAVWRALRRRSG
jgi:GT2 family glycosyltransferase